MKRKQMAIMVILMNLLPLSAIQAKPARNPVIWADVPDVAVIRVGDTYYMSSTTMHMSPGLPIMTSKNLVDWNMLTYAYDRLVENDAMNLENGRTAYGQGSWASCLRFHNGTYYATTFSSTSGRTHIYTTGNIEKGDWKASSFSPSLHDNTLFFDDDGRVYMIYGAGKLTLVELEPDLSGIKQGGVNKVIIENANLLFGENEVGGLKGEGSQLLKVNGTYYLMNIGSPRSRWSRSVLISRADKITGPYEGRVGLEDQGVAQGCLIDTPDGKWYAMLFQDNGSVGRSPWLVPVTWKDGWPVFGIDGKAPTTTDIEDSEKLPDSNIVASDEFNRKPGEPLPLAWQWNHNPDNSKWSIGEREGYLRLTTGRVDRDVLSARNTLTQRTFGPVCSATTKVDVTHMKDGDYAGLIALQQRFGAVCVKMENGAKSIVMMGVDAQQRGQRGRRNPPSPPVEIESVPLAQSTAYFKIDCDYRNRADKATFYYSLDSKTWTKIGSVLQMSYTMPHFMGYRFGLFNYATQTAGGYVDFDYYRVSDEIQTDTMAEADPNFYIFLCFGQSNMEGFPGIGDQDKTAVDERFQMLATVDFPMQERTKGHWYNAVPPLCRGNSGLCPADYFGRTLVAALPDNIRVGVVNVSVAGCRIELFEKDTYKTYAETAPSWMANIIKAYDGNPYQHLVDIARLAQKDGMVKGILLHQGESNTGDKQWPAKVKGIYDNLIKDLNLNAEDVPLLAGEVVSADQGGACASMNAIIAELPTVLPNAHVISSKGCVARRDHLHFTPEGYRELGKRYAEQMLSILGYEIPDPVALTVHTDQTTKTISTGIYGQFLEHIFHSVHGGLWGDQILNGTLELSPPRMRRSSTRGPSTLTAITPRNWEFIGDPNEVSMDRDDPFNAEVSVRLAARVGGDPEAGPGIRQRNIALKQGERYTFSFHARGNNNIIVTFKDGDTAVFTKTFTGLTAQWKKYSVEFTALCSVPVASLTIGSSPSGPVNIDQISLFSASALALGGYRPDLYQAVADLQPASIRWPGGSFANRYIWQNAIGPREKRLPHPSEQWGDRDTYQFGTDEFIQFCDKVGAEPILVLNTSRGVEDALNWLEYCMGDASTEYGKQRAANGHPEPYQLKTLEIDNEPWLMMDYDKYLDIVKRFCPAIRAKYPDLKLSVAGSYGYDTGPGEGNQEANRNWDPRIIEQAGTLFDILSPHYYNGIYFTADHENDPYKYEEFLNGHGEIIRNSANPNMKIYVSEWNLTKGEWGNDWRVGLYAGGILNAFERQGDIVTMSCPALFLRKQGVTNSWDNALINFDQTTWFPAGNYVVMKLWREAFAPNLLAVDGQDRPLNFVAVRSADKQTVFLKVVNPTQSTVAAAVRFDGDLTPGNATLKLIAPGGETVKNSLEEPDNIKVVAATATVKGRTVQFTMPPLSAGVVRVTP